MSQAILGPFPKVWQLLHEHPCAYARRSVGEQWYDCMIYLTVVSYSPIFLSAS